MDETPGDADVLAELEAEVERREEERVYRDLWESEEPPVRDDLGGVDDDEF